MEFLFSIGGGGGGGGSEISGIPPHSQVYLNGTALI